MTRKSQSGQKKPTHKKRRSLQRVVEARKSNPTTGERETENQSARKEAEKEVCSACWEHETATRSQPVTDEASKRTRNGRA